MTEALRAMVDPMDPTLTTLRDVDGIMGSFVVSDRGHLMARDLPAMFDDAVLADVGPRLLRLRETLLSNGDDLESCVIRFTEYKLIVRAIVGGLICVLAGVSVNMPALRMAVNLAARKLSPRLVQSDRPTDWMVPTGVPISERPPSMPPAPKEQATMIYRGRRVPMP